MRNADPFEVIWVVNGIAGIVLGLMGLAVTYRDEAVLDEAKVNGSALRGVKSRRRLSAVLAAVMLGNALVGLAAMWVPSSVRTPFGWFALAVLIGGGIALNWAFFMEWRDRRWRLKHDDNYEKGVGYAAAVQ